MPTSFYIITSNHVFVRGSFVLFREFLLGYTYFKIKTISFVTTLYVINLLMELLLGIFPLRS